MATSEGKSEAGLNNYLEYLTYLSSRRNSIHGFCLALRLGNGKFLADGNRGVCLDGDLKGGLW